MTSMPDARCPTGSQNTNNGNGGGAGSTEQVNVVDYDDHDQPPTQLAALLSNVVCLLSRRAEVKIVGVQK